MAGFRLRNFKLIEDQAEVETAIAQLESATSLAIDTEFTRERTFFPIPSLIQISDGRKIYLFDAIKTDLTPLCDILSNSSLEKIIHSASQDLEVFEQLIDKPLENIVDSQIAAQFLQHANLGLAGLLNDLLDIQLEKSQTVSDWSRRPLSEKQLHYASEDVLHLHELYACLKKELEKANKLEFFMEECREMGHQRSTTDNILEKNLKSTDSDRFRAVLKDLIEWREAMAKRINLPRTWILKDVQLKKIAQSEDTTKWEHPEILSPKQMRQYGPTFTGFHQQHQDLSPKRISISQEDRILFDQMSAKFRKRIQKTMDQWNIPAEIFSNQRNLKSRIQNMIRERKFIPWSGWRGQLLNEPLGQQFKSFFVDE